MLNDLILEKSNAPPLLEGYAAPSVRRSKVWGGSFVKAQDEVDWANLLIAVRDRQDKAAFAALFRHFAPRIKGFLMKSGFHHRPQPPHRRAAQITQAGTGRSALGPGGRAGSGRRA